LVVGCSVVGSCLLVLSLLSGSPACPAQATFQIEFRRFINFPQKTQTIESGNGNGEWKMDGNVAAGSYNIDHG